MTALSRVSSILTVLFVLGISPGDSCCTHEKVSLTMTIIADTLPANSAVPTITQARIWLDSDYGAQIERAQVSYLNEGNYEWANLTYNFNDYNTGIAYYYSDNSCTAEPMPPGSVMLGPCINTTFTNTKLDHSYKILPGDQDIVVDVYTGVYLGDLRVTWHALASDCSPVYMTFYGQEQDGPFHTESYNVEYVKQGSLREDNAVELPAACQALDVTTMIGK